MSAAVGGSIVDAMTETLHETPPPPPPPPAERRLARDPDDQVVAGVCAALGRYTGTDPVLWRVTVAVLAVFGGAGLALYIAGWLLIPKVGEPESWAERNLRNPDRGLSAAGIVALVLVGVVVLGMVDEGPGIGVLLVIGAIAYLVIRERKDRPPAAVAYGPPVPGAPAPDPSAYAPVPPPPPRKRSPLGGITLSLAAVVTGILLAVRESGADELTVPRILAVALVVIGAGLLVGTVWGRARWLILPGLIVALALGATSSAGSSGFGDGLGERTWRAADGGDYSLGAGQATLDLRGLRGLESAQVEASVGFGQLTVLVPTGMSVRVDSSVGLGEISADDADLDGDRGGGGREEQFVVGSADDVTVELDLEVGMGQIEVRRVGR